MQLRSDDLKFILEGVKSHGFTDDLSRFTGESEYYEWLLSTGIYRALLFRKDFIKAFMEFLKEDCKVDHKLTEAKVITAFFKEHDPMQFLQETLRTHKLNDKSDNPDDKPNI